MDKEQADAVAQALLGPEQQVQEDTRRRRALKQAGRVRLRQVAMWGLVFAAEGVGLAYLCDQRWFYGAVVGALAGYLLGWIFTRRRS